MPLELRLDNSDLAREKVAFILRVVYKHPFKTEDVVGVQVLEDRFVASLPGGQTYEGTGFELEFLKQSIRAPNGWTIPEQF
jgi:hypothetical protein